MKHHSLHFPWIWIGNSSGKVAVHVQPAVHTGELVLLVCFVREIPRDDGVPLLDFFAELGLFAVGAWAHAEETPLAVLVSGVKNMIKSVML